MNVAHRREVLDIVRSSLLDDPKDFGGVSHVSIVEKDLDVLLMGILVEMINSACVE